MCGPGGEPPPLSPYRVRMLVVFPSLLLLAVLIVFFLAVPALVDGHLNQTRPGGPYPVSVRARAPPPRLLVAHLPAHPLVWGRDPLAPPPPAPLALPPPPHRWASLPALS